jgi:hypothetical protein
MTTHDAVERFNNKKKKTFLEGIHHNLSSPSYLTLAKYNTLKNEAMASTSQLWAVLVKLIIHWMAPPENSTSRNKSILYASYIK